MRGARVGIGFDFHSFDTERPLILGGAHIPHDRGLSGHSDADVLLHAVADALLGAAGMSDIGSYFPDTDDCWEGVSSLLLLEKVERLVRGREWRLANLDSVIIAEEPLMRPHIPAMRANIARTLRVEPARIGIKATTMEKRGVVGRAEGIAAQAVVLLEPVP